MNHGLLSGRRGIRVALGLLAVLCLGPAASQSPAADNVAGNLINFNNDGMWSWYMDERAIVDPTNGKLLIGSVTSSPVTYPTGRPTGGVDIATYDIATGSRSRFQLSDIDEDDHNVPGITILPNGKYLAMYSNHGNTAMGDYLSRYRISTNAHDSSSWTAEQSFNWQTVTGWNVAPNANNRVSYHNLFYLSADDGGNGRLYDFSRGTHQSSNSLLFNQLTNTWSWGGQLTTSSSGGYSTGYIKYASNGVDKIYFVSTETHPRNFNNNLWAGYISDGKTYDMVGNLIDANMFDNEDTAGVGAVPDINKFTNARLADGNTLQNPAANPNANGIGMHRLWTVDLSLDGNQNPVAMYIGRNDADASNPGNDTNIDHRIYYARWNGTQWVNSELARMGDRLYTPEEDYTGIGALVPGDPNTVYISTQYDPRDPSGATTTTWREIYKGATANGGANWTWTPITSGSSVNNLRPIVPAWDSDHTAVVWFRGTYTSAQNTDAAVVGIVERNDEEVGLVHYVDATTSNTTFTNGTPFTGWTVNNTAGNGGNVITAQAGVSTIKTQLTGLADGKYDIFAYFYADQTNDWRIQAGLNSGNLQLFRDNGAQQAELSQFDSAVTLTGGGGYLYRAYMGRVDVLGGTPVEVFIDDFATGATTRAWYDGLGYALVSPVVPPLAGDFNGDQVVDAADYVVWRKGLGTIYTQDDYNDWAANFGATAGSGSSVTGAAIVPEPAPVLSLVIAATVLVLGVRTWR